MTIYTYISNGPKVLYVGENSEVIGIYENCSPIVSGSPGWISSNFGDGKVVVFTTHPEMVTYDEDNNDGTKWEWSTFRESTFDAILDDRGSPGSNGYDQILTSGFKLDLKAKNPLYSILIIKGSSNNCF